MINLSELSSEQSFVKLLLVGESGSGKTVNSVTFPGKKLVADFDNKIESAALFYAKDKNFLNNIDVKLYGRMPIKPLSGQKSRMKSFLDDLQGYYDLQNKKQKLPFDTYILDTASFMADAILEDYRVVSQLGIKRPNPDQNSQSDYGLLATHVKQIISGLLTLDANIVIIGHTQREKDETSGIITNQIMFPGAMSQKMGSYFLETYFAKIVNGQHIWQTKADAKSPFCKTARNLPPEIPANFAEIVKVR